MPFKTLLLYPPQSSPDQPYSSLPCLAGFLRAQGCLVEQRDLNIEAYVSLLAPRRLQAATTHIALQLHELERKRPLSEPEQKRAETLLKALTAAPYVVDHIDEAMRAVRDPEQFYDLNRCWWAHNVLQRGLEIISAEYCPTRWDLIHLHMRAFTVGQKPNPTVEVLLQATRDEAENVFLSYFRREVLPQILQASPQLIGLSVTYLTQIIPALTLARLIKEAAPAIHVCVGGARVGYDPLWIQPAVFSVIDSVIAGEGEHALLALIHKLERQDDDLGDVPNLIYRRDGQIRQNPPVLIEDVNELPTPDWAGLPLALYFSPDFVAMLPTSRGCYWGRCAFCTVSQATSRRYRPRRIDLVLKDMRTLYERHGVTQFFLAADAEPPKRMQQLAAAIREQGLPFVWQSETRFSTQLTAEACHRLFEGGCRYLILGLESASQRVLDLMDKGIRVADYGAVLRNCRQAGIALNMQAFLGFPTETEAEARSTVDFLLDNRACIESFGFASFMLQPSSKVDREPGKYCVTHIDRQAGGDIVLSYDYQVSQGMSQEEARRQVNRHLPWLEKCFITAPLNVSFLYSSLYVARYGLDTLEKQKKAWRFSLDDLNLKPHAAEWLVRRAFCFDGPGSTRTALFSPASAELWVADSQMLRLLALCNGRRSVEDIATEFAKAAESTGGFIVGYFQAIEKIQGWCQSGMLEIGDRVHDPVVPCPDPG